MKVSTSSNSWSSDNNNIAVIILLPNIRRLFTEQSVTVTFLFILLAINGQMM